MHRTSPRMPSTLCTHPSWQRFLATCWRAALMQSKEQGFRSSLEFSREHLHVYAISFAHLFPYSRMSLRSIAALHSMRTSRRPTLESSTESFLTSTALSPRAGPTARALLATMQQHDSTLTDSTRSVHGSTIPLYVNRYELYPFILMVCFGSRSCVVNNVKCTRTVLSHIEKNWKRWMAEVHALRTLVSELSAENLEIQSSLDIANQRCEKLVKQVSLCSVFFFFFFLIFFSLIFSSRLFFFFLLLFVKKSLFRTTFSFGIPYL